MKKLGGVFLILIIFATMCSASFLWQPSGNVLASQINEQTELFEQTVSRTSLLSTHPIETSTDFPARHSWFTLSGFTRGIYIQKPGGEYAYNDIFFGSVRVDLDTLPYTDFEFRTVRMVNGQWQQTDWFEIFPHANGLNVGWELRKILPAGRYGIHAVPYERIWVDGKWERREVEIWLEGETLYRHDVIYEILYAEQLRYIMGNDGQGNSSINIYGRNTRSFIINVEMNDGAMDMNALVPEFISNGVPMGNLYIATEIDMLQMRISIIRDGANITNSTHIASYGNAIQVTLPDSLAQSQYIVRMTHPANNSIFGTYIIDNTPGGVGGGSMDLGWLVIAIFVLGTLFALVALYLFSTPRIQRSLEMRRFHAQENARYLASGEASDDRYYKAQSQKSSLRNSFKRIESGEDVLETKKADHKTKSRGFLETIRDSRARRETARDAGLTMEEFRELESKQKKIDKAREGSLREFRGEGPALVEVEQQIDTRKIVDGVEFDTLNSFNTNETDFAGMDFAPMPTSTEGAKDFDIKEIEPELPAQKPSGSILSRLRNAQEGN